MVSTGNGAGIGGAWVEVLATARAGLSGSPGRYLLGGANVTGTCWNARSKPGESNEGRGVLPWLRVNVEFQAPIQPATSE